MSQGGSSGLKFNQSVKSRKESSNAKSQSPSIKMRKSSCSSIDANASIASSDLHMFMDFTHNIWKQPIPSHRKKQKATNVAMIKVIAALGDKDSFAIVPNSSFMTNSTIVSSANYIDSQSKRNVVLQTICNKRCGYMFQDLSNQPLRIPGKKQLKNKENSNPRHFKIKESSTSLKSNTILKSFLAK